MLKATCVCSCVLSPSSSEYHPEPQATRVPVTKPPTKPPSLATAGDGIVSGSRDQSVVTWAVTPSGLKSEVIFDDLQQSPGPAERDRKGVTYSDQEVGPL